MLLLLGLSPACGVRGGAQRPVTPQCPGARRWAGWRRAGSFSLGPRNEWCTMRLSPARAPLNAQSLHPNSVAMMASGSSARIALSRFWLVLGLLWLVASVVWFSGQMADRTCAARTGRARKTLRGPAVGSTRPLSKQVVPLPAEMPVLLDDDAKVHPTWQRARFGPQPRLPGRHPTPRRRRRGVTMFFFSLPRPPEHPSQATQQRRRARSHMKCCKKSQGHRRHFNELSPMDWKNRQAG